MITLENIIDFFDKCIENNVSILIYGNYNISVCEKTPTKCEGIDQWYYKNLEFYHRINSSGELEINIDRSEDAYLFIKTKEDKDKALWTLCLDKINNYVKLRAEQKFNSFKWK